MRETQTWRVRERETEMKNARVMEGSRERMTERDGE